MLVWYCSTWKNWKRKKRNWKRRREESRVNNFIYYIKFSREHYISFSPSTIRFQPQNLLCSTRKLSGLWHILNRLRGLTTSTVNRFYLPPIQHTLWTRNLWTSPLDLTSCFSLRDYVSSHYAHPHPSSQQACRLDSTVHMTHQSLIHQLSSTHNCPFRWPDCRLFTSTRILSLQHHFVWQPHLPPAAIYVHRLIYCRRPTVRLHYRHSTDLDSLLSAFPLTFSSSWDCRLTFISSFIAVVV